MYVIETYLMIHQVGEPCSQSSIYSARCQDYPSCDASMTLGYARQARYAQCSALLQAWLALLHEAKGAL